jgi:hypothetical protein
VSGNPFEALGLPVQRELSDEQVRAAWRSVAAATHPDRRDGGDLARYTAATAAYVQLRTGWGRSEAFADVVAAGDDTSPLPAVPGSDEGEAWAGPEAGSPVRVVELIGGWTWQLPARVRHGRPGRLFVRGVVAALACLGVLALIPGQPAAPPLVAALIVWFLMSGRCDLAPRRER